MRGLRKLTHAANTMQAWKDYRQLVRLAVDAGVTEPIPLPPANAGWRTLDKSADVLIIYILKAKPELREQIRAIYPGSRGAV